jgi:hypothetical protein
MQTPKSTVNPALRDSALSAGTDPIGGSRLRLSLSESLGRGGLDGAWWPRSRNLDAELADLVVHFPGTAGRIVRAVYSVPDWLPAQRRIHVNNRVLKVGFFPHDDSHRILLAMSSRQILHLMVVPPGSSSTLALAVMATAASPSNRDSAAAVLHDALRAEAQAAESAARWADDGGLWWEPRSPRYVTRGKWRT